MTILCCGGRDWSSWSAIGRELATFDPDNTIVVHGDCRGADKMCGQVALNYGFTVKAYPADWNQHGRAAGVIRNQLMLDKHPEIELVLAFHDDINASRGTRDMVRRARKAGIKVRVVTSFASNLPLIYAS